MTAHKGPITIGGTPLHQRLVDSIPDLVDAVLARLVERLPAYAQLPREELDGDISRIIERSIRAFGEILRTGEPAAPEMLASLTESVSQRAGEGVPIDAVLSAHHLGVQVSWEHLARHAEPGDLADVLQVSLVQLRYLQDITAAVASGYFRELRTTFGEEQAAQQAMLSALLNGDQLAETATVTGFRLAPAYFVLSVAIAAHPDEHRAGVNPAVVARRKLRRMRGEFERVAPEQVLSALQSGGGIALIPHHSKENIGHGWDWLRALVSSASRAAGADITVGAVVVEPDEVADAAVTAREVLDVALVTGRPPGVYRLPDVALEIQLSRPGPARDELARQLDPLVGKPELLTTLRAYFQNDLNRRRTAARLHIHPNTVDYRLRKITALTGLDTTVPAGLPRIRAVLTAATYGNRGPLGDAPSPSGPSPDVPS